MDKYCRLSRLDWLLLCAITVLYSLFALHDLGSRVAPENAMTLGPDCGYCFVFSESPSAMCWFDGPQPDPRQDPAVTVRYSSLDDLQNYFHQQEISFGKVFTWQSVSLPQWDLQGDKLVITLSFDREVPVMELVFVDESGSRILPENIEFYPGLFDEQETLPRWLGFRNGMYFDEIYHARSAYELLNGLYCYENTHPPLGKLLIGLGILIFGMNPFGWRIVGTLFGIAMCPVMYVFCKRMTRSTPLSTLGCWLLAFDFMHFVQTRIATIDVYITFFVMAMYLFMYEYVFLTQKDKPFKESLRPLFFCGLAMGLGIACKWTGVYAGAGLAVIFFASLLRQRSPRESAAEYRRRAWRTMGLCVVFFVVVPAIIYTLSYLPFEDGSNHSVLRKMLENQFDMFAYHTNEQRAHRFASRWYEWPIMVRPIWYFADIITGAEGSGGLRENISAFGNPAVWWLGIPAAVYMVFRALVRKDRTAAFLLVGYCAQYLPWSLISRSTFIYHYFPSVPFVVLMLAHSLSCWKDRLSRRGLMAVCIGYGAVVFGLFLLFYPVLAGQAVDAAFITEKLRWLDSWVLTLE